MNIEDRRRAVNEIFFSSLRYEICNSDGENIKAHDLTGDVLGSLYAFSKAQDLVHIVGAALDELEKLSDDDISLEFKKQNMLSFARYHKMKHELQRICETLEKAKIPFIVLKGSVLRNYYPKPWLRTSCDIDVFLSLDNLNLAKDVLVEQLAYREGGTWESELSLYSSNDVHVELHYLEPEENGIEMSVLDNVWENSKKKPGFEYQYEMCWEYFYLYHISHMAKHFLSRGCGVRPFLDIYVMNKSFEIDREKLTLLLEKYKLLTFATVVENLTRIWFSEEKYEHTSLTKKVEKYVLFGGIYGNIENHYAIQRAKGEGKNESLLLRIFHPYEKLKLRYPSLEKRRWLTPFYQVRRWFEIIYGGGLKYLRNEVKANRKVSEERVDEVKDLLDSLGL